MTPRLPRISLVIPSFNQGAYLEQAIRSIVDQRYPDLELIVIDGGSTDESLPIIRRHAGAFAHWEHEPDRGQFHALNKGFARATGEVMGWLNADDVLMPGALAIVGRVFGDYPQIRWLTSGAIHISTEGTPFGLHHARRYYARWVQLFANAPPPQHCTFWRRSLWEEAGSHVAEQFYSDCELWLRFYEHAPLHVVDTILGAWRLHPGSHSIIHHESMSAQIAAAQAASYRRFLEGRWWLRPFVPALRALARRARRGSTNHLLFKLRTRRTRWLTFDLEAGRFRLPSDRPGRGSNR